MRKFIAAILLTVFSVLCCAVLPAGAAMASKRSVLSNGIVLLSSEQKVKYLQLQRQDSLRRAEMDRKRNGHP